MAFVVRRVGMHVAVRSRWMGKRAVQLPLTHLLPGALRVLFGATHARCEILQTVHVKPPTPVAGRQYALTLAQAFHSVDHLRLERTTVIFLRRLTRALTGCRKKI